MTSGCDPLLGSSFSEVADLYDDVRPAYPDELYDVVETAVGGLAGRRVLDLAAGTGIATRALLARGASVIAIDPGAPMLRRLRQQSPGVPVVVGEGERIPLQDNSVDLVTCATAWHWLDAELAVAAVRRVARAGGHLALWWANHRFGDGIAWEEAQSEIMARYELVRGSRASSPRAIGVDDAADGLRALGLHVVVDTELHWTRTVSRETHVQTIATHSNRIMLPPELRQQVLDDISEVLQPWPVVEQRLRGPVVVAEI